MYRKKAVESNRTCYKYSFAQHNFCFNHYALSLICPSYIYIKKVLNYSKPAVQHIQHFRQTAKIESEVSISSSSSSFGARVTVTAESSGMLLGYFGLTNQILQERCLNDWLHETKQTNKQKIRVENAVALFFRCMSMRWYSHSPFSRSRHFHLVNTILARNGIPTT